MQNCFSFFAWYNDYNDIQAIFGKTAPGNTDTAPNVTEMRQHVTGTCLALAQRSIHKIRGNCVAVPPYFSQYQHQMQCLLSNTSLFQIAGK